MELIDRLVFGTGRLASGPYAAQSRRLIEACLTAGIRRFDTAPSYGMGASEALLGQVIGAMPDVFVATKLGSSAPPHSALRGWAKRAYNLVPRTRNEQIGACDELRQHSGAAPDFNYSPDNFARSFERSLSRLRRDHIDMLLIHEAEPAEIPPPSVQFMERQATLGTAREIGFAHLGPALTTAPGWVIQIAPRVDDFCGRRSYPAPVRFHSIRTAARAAAAADPMVRDRFAAAQRELGENRTGEDGVLAGAILVLARAYPRCELIFFSSRSDHLASNLAQFRRASELTAA